MNHNHRDADCIVSNKNNVRRRRLGRLPGRAAFFTAAGLAVAGTLAMPSLTHAATQTWTGTTSVDWNTITNWSIAVPVAGDTALFNGAGNGHTSLTLTTAGNVLDITFDTATVAAYTIGTTGGSALNLGAGGAVTLTSTDATAQIINAPLVLGGNYSFLNNSTTAAAVLTIGGNVTGPATTGTTTLTLNSANTGTNTISGIISDGNTGAGDLLGVAVSGGIWNLSGANTYTGGTTINGGTLSISGAGSIATSSGVADNGTFDISATTSGASIVSLSGSGAVNLGTKTLTLTNAGGTFSGAINGTGGLILTTGTETLAGTNTYTGGTTITNGTLAITSDAALGTGGITFSGGTLQLNNYTSSLNFAGQAVQLGVVAGGSTTLAGTISNGTGTGSLTYVGPGTLTLTGANTYTGGTTIKAGTLAIGVDTELGTGSITFGGGTLQLDNYASSLSFSGQAVQLGAATGSASTLNGIISDGASAASLTYVGLGTLNLSAINTYTGATTINGGTLALSSTGSIADSSGVADNGTFDISATSGASIKSLSGAGTVNLGTKTLTLTDAGGTFSGVIQDTGTGGSFILFSGTEVLSGANTYTGGTTVDTGATAAAGNAAAFGTGPLTIEGGGTLETVNATAAATSAGIAMDVGGDFTMNGGTPNSTLVLTIASRSSSGPNYDSVNLTGSSANNTATFTGSNTLTIQSEAGVKPADLDSYTVVGTTGTVTSSGTPSGLPFITDSTPGAPANRLPTTTDPNFTTDNVYFYEKVVPGTGVVVTAQTNFAAFAITPNELAVANYLDTYATPSANIPADLQTLLAQLSSLPPNSTNSTNEIGPALDQLTPQAEQILGSIGIQNAVFQSQTVFAQIEEQLTGGTGFNDAGLSLLDAPNADPFAVALNSAMQSVARQVDQASQPVSNLDADNSDDDSGDDSGDNSDQNTISGFISGNAMHAEKLPGTLTNQPTSFTTGGLMAGLDYAVASHLAVGAWFAYENTHARLDDNGSTLKDQSISPGVYLGFHQDHFYVDALASYTYNSYKMKRNISFTSPISTASSSPRANQYDADVMGGYNFYLGNGLKLGPAVGGGYTHMNIAGYSESGSPADLTVSPLAIDSLRSLVGGRISWTWNPPNTWPINLNANAFWQHEFLNDSRAVTATFTELGAGSFVVDTASPDRDSALLGFGASGNLSSGVTLFVNYEAQIGGGRLFAQTVMGGVAIGLK